MVLTLQRTMSDYLKHTHSWHSHGTNFTIHACHNTTRSL